MEVEHIPGNELFQIGEHLLGRHTAVTGQNGMSAFSTDWERAAQQMPDAAFQRIIFGAVINGQIYADFWNYHIAHNAVSSDIELIVIVFGCCLQSFLTVGFCRTWDDGEVVSIGKFLCFKKFAVICLLNNLLIGSMNLGSILLVYIITDNGIQGQPQGQQERNDRQGDCDTLLLRRKPSFWGKPRRNVPPGRR